MKKFWKESRTLTIALSLLLCCIIGVVWATGPCQWCMSFWTDADDAETLMQTASDEAQDLLLYLTEEDGLSDQLIFCYDNHGGVDLEDEQDWEDWGNLARAAIDYGYDDIIDALDLKDLANANVVAGALACVDSDPCEVASAIYGLAATQFGGADACFDLAKADYSNAEDAMWLCQGILIAQEWDEELEDWVDCDCWQ